MIFPLLAGICAASFMATARDGGLVAWKAWWQSLTNPATSERAADLFKVQLLDQINYARIAAKATPLQVDPELQKFLERYEQELPCDNPDDITQNVQASLPRYFRVSVCTATRPNPDDLFQEFRPFSQKTDREMTHFGCMLKNAAGGLSQTCLVVVGQKLEDFSPEQLNARKTDAFFNVCSLCGHPHVCRVSYEQRSLTLECPSCARTYAVVASDSHGNYRYVNEFLSGYQPPAKFPKDQSRIQKLFTIWGAVHQHCAYTLDPDGKKKVQTDSWQTALETQNKQRGDCEDSSIFLAEWLASQGFQVRVALGKYGDMGGHAWCVVRLDGTDYLLESTEGKPDVNNPPLADIVGSRYVPEVQFDRNAIYVRSKPRQTWSGDYWSGRMWTRIEPRNPFASISQGDSKGTQRLSVDTRQASRFFVDKSRMTVAQSPQTALAPFTNLSNVPTGSRWELQIPDKFATDHAPAAGLK